MEDDIWVPYFITFHKLCLNSINSRQRKLDFAIKAIFVKANVTWPLTQLLREH